ncbi:hypothetical protein NW754_16769 [Fusarium falciforme]|nr:hypothetical protein NW754_16769 [Fusarium falciforme]
MVQKRACDACHKRKIQCDSTSSKTPCNWCEHHGLACTFNRVRRPEEEGKAQVSGVGSAHRHAPKLDRAVSKPPFGMLTRPQNHSKLRTKSCKEARAHRRCIGSNSCSSAWYRYLINIGPLQAINSYFHKCNNNTSASH